MHFEHGLYSIDINGKPQKAMLPGHQLLSFLVERNVSLSTEFKHHLENHLKVPHPSTWETQSLRYQHMNVNIVYCGYGYDPLYAVRVNDGKKILMEPEEVVSFCDALDFPCPAEIRSQTKKV